MSAHSQISSRLPWYRIKAFSGMLLKRRKIILLSLAWGIIISLIIIKTHFFFYLSSQRLTVYRIAWSSYEGPEFTDLDLALLFFSSLVVGLIATDAKRMIYGYFTAILMSTTIAILYVFTYDWVTLRLGEVLTQTPFGWETGLYMAFLNVLRFMFPMGMVICLIGSIIGNIVATWMRL